jgi:hypothetical protein
MEKYPSKPIYGLVYGIPGQAKIIDEYCFKKCGKIIVGGMTHELVGPLMICRTPKKQCPQFNREMDDPCGEVMGDPVYIRKLKEE